MSDARSVLDKELGNSGTEENSSNCEQNSSPSKKQRKRTKNKRLDGYETSQDDEPSKKKPKTSEGRKKAGGSKENDSESQNRKKNARKDHDDAAEKERKRIEKEQANKQREKERQALTERNNMLLERMTALVSNQSAEDPFDSDVVSECVDLTTSSTPPSNPVHRLQNTVNELRSATPERVLSISQLQKTLDMLQGNSEVPTNHTIYLSDSNSITAENLSDHTAGCVGRTSIHNTSSADAKFHHTSVKISSDNSAWQINRSATVNTKSTERSHHFRSTKNPTDKHTQKFSKQKTRLSSQTNCGW
ncbi:hypothetical protein ABFA07_021840 [Porites harrisoni]